MNEFVERCRREWRRLGVPEALAEEMATDLASDLREAEADGVSAEELLGSGAFDPPTFAAAWASERGVVPGPPSRGAGRRKPVSLVAFTATSAIALLVAAALLVTGEPKLTLRAHVSRPPGAVGPLPPATGTHSTSASAPIEWVFLALAIIALGFAVRLWTTWRRSQPPVASA